MKSTKQFVFQKKIMGFADEYDMLPRDGLIIVAVSGGVDSVCLLDVISEISPKRGFQIAAAHFNHKLRGDESDCDELFVTGECKNRDIKLITDSSDVRAYALDKGLGIVEAARECRYAFFERAADELGTVLDCETVRVATAHNADDLAETLIINLVRGAGTLGMSGIPPVRGRIIRPMLHISRDEIMEYIDVKGLTFVEDSSNALENQARNRIRHKVMPVLKEINHGFPNMATRAAELTRRDEEYLQGLVDEYLKSCDEYIKSRTLSVKGINSLPLPIASRVVKRMGNGLSFQHINDVIDLCTNKKPVASLSLPGMTVKKEYDKLYFVM